MGYFFSFSALSKSSTETGLDVSELLILVCGLVLAIGAAGEYLEEHGKLPPWMEWSRKPKLVFVWMVAISLGGEFVGDAGVFVFSGHLQTIQDDQLLALGSSAGQLEARLKIVGDKATKAESIAGTASTASSEAATRSGRALSTASTAVKSASNALTIARGARQEADTFESDIKTARKEAADALANLADAKRLAEEAQKGTAILTQAALPRRLSEERKRELVRSLSTVPTFTVVFEAARSGSKEVFDFTDDLMDVFKRMGLISPDSSANKLSRSLGSPEGRGVIIGAMGAGPAEHPPAADVLIRTLNGWGFEASGEVAPNIAKSATEIHILVGAKQ